MRALLVNAHGADLAFGGAERYVADLARGLEARGHEVSVLSAFPVRQDAVPGRTITLHPDDWRGSPGRRLRNHAGDVASIPGRSLRRTVEAARPDLVHTSNLPGISTAVWEIGRRLGVPVVHTLHDYYLLCPRVTLAREDGSPCRPHPLLCGLRTRRLTRWAGGVAHVIAGSEHLLRAHDGLLPTAGRHVIRLPLSPLAGRPLSPPRTPPRAVGYLGALERTKGLEVLLDAAPALAELGFALRIAGDGRLRPAVEAAAGDGLDYVGQVRDGDKLAFMESVDLALLPSAWAEPSGPPYALLEWLAAGRPVLASTRGGLAEAQSIPGVFPVEPEPGGIVEGVRRLAGEPAWGEALSRLTKAGGADVERWLDEHEAVYREALR